MKFGDETERAGKEEEGNGVSVNAFDNLKQGWEDGGGERGRQFSRDDTEVRSFSGVDAGSFWTLRVDRVNTWT